ncbi:VTT domain-containing protein [Nitrosopumilus sp. Nsub]|uniref:YqaA family protein n=1 Tax=Nitrosopumilus sp. Nsub TaxID=1776294 RepID=UPI000ADA3A10|nr:VTT domain-containing protein [Nitrosopumilus sp. Nsub]
MSYKLIIEYYQQIQEILSNNYFQEYGVIGLFLNSLLSATAIPIPTEILTSALLIGGENIFLVSLALIIGSVIGGILNYFIGFGGNKLFKKIKKETDIEKNEKKHNKILDKFGWSAIFFAAWIPVIGDLILISAGVKKMKLVKFSIFMVSGKIVKTIIVVVGLGTIF